MEQKIIEKLLKAKEILNIKYQILKNQKEKQDKFLEITFRLFERAEKENKELKKIINGRRKKKDIRKISKRN